MSEVTTDNELTPRQIRRKNRRRRNKIINGAVILISSALILSYLLDYSSTGVPPGLSPDRDVTPQVKYFLTGVHSTEFDSETGSLAFSLSAEEVKHNPADDSSQLKSPLFQLFNAGTNTWIVNAQLGVISADGNTIDLQQRVLARSTDGDTIMKTPQLTIYPNKKLVKTDKPVTLQNPYGFTRSIGLEADMQTKRIDLLQQVHGQYQGIRLEDEK